MIGYIALGSNLGDRQSLLLKTISGIDRLPVTRVIRRSSIYRSLPMGGISQPLFLNSVVQVRTRLSPRALLVELQEIERRSGRVRKLKWGPRTLDLDILVHGGSIVRHEDLTIPHPGIPLRAFVLYPLAEIAPNLQIPGMGTPISLIKNCRGPRPSRVRVDRGAYRWEPSCGSGRNQDYGS